MPVLIDKVKKWISNNLYESVTLEKMADFLDENGFRRVSQVKKYFPLKMATLQVIYLKRIDFRVG